MSSAALQRGAAGLLATLRADLGYAGEERGIACRIAAKRLLITPPIRAHDTTVGQRYPESLGAQQHWLTPGGHELCQPPGLSFRSSSSSLNRTLTT
jgi:hypothetical protein